MNTNTNFAPHPDSMPIRGGDRHAGAAWHERRLRERRRHCVASRRRRWSPNGRVSRASGQLSCRPRATEWLSAIDTKARPQRSIGAGGTGRCRLPVRRAESFEGEADNANGSAELGEPFARPIPPGRRGPPTQGFLAQGNVIGEAPVAEEDRASTPPGAVPLRLPLPPALR